MRFFYVISNFIFQYATAKKSNTKIGKWTKAFKCKFGGENLVLDKVNIEKSVLGKKTYIGSYSSLPSCIIGSFCSIASNVKLIAGTHPISFVSTYPGFFNTCNKSLYHYNDTAMFNEFTYADKENKKFIVIGNDVWIGSDARIMNGVTIGDGAIIGACALVTKDVPPYAIVGGVPAKIIRYRFDEENIKFLLELKWWNKSENWIKEHAKYFADVEKLKVELRKLNC